MLKFLCALSMIALCLVAPAQTPTGIDPQAEAFYNKVMPVMKPSYKSVVLQSAAGMKGRAPNSDSLVKALTKNPAFASLSQQDVQALALLVMVEADKSAQQDLKLVMGQVKESNVKKQSIRKPVQVDSTRRIQDLKGADADEKSDLTDEQQLRVAMITDRRQKANAMMSNLMKKISDTEEEIIRNFK